MAEKSVGPSVFRISWFFSNQQLTGARKADCKSVSKTEDAVDLLARTVNRKPAYRLIETLVKFLWTV